MALVRTPALIAVLAAAAVGVLAGTVVVRPAQAQAPRTAACTGGIKPSDKLPPAYSGVPPASLETQAAWMNEQMAQGRTNFTLSPAYTGTGPQLVLCAW